VNTALNAMLSRPATIRITTAPPTPAAMSTDVAVATTNTSRTCAVPSPNWKRNRLTISELRAIGMLSSLSR
jgi:hypothetical protein